MKKRHLITLFTFFVFSIVTIAQSNKDEKWQMHKQKVAQKMAETEASEKYIDNLSAIVGLSNNQKMVLASSYEKYYKTKIQVYAGKADKKEDKMSINAAYQIYKKKEEQMLTDKQKIKLKAYYTTKKQEIQAKHIQKINDSLSIKNN